MKKYFMLLLCLAFLFSLVACGPSSEQLKTETSSEEISVLSQDTESNVEQDESENSGLAQDVLISCETNFYGGKLSEEYEVLCSGFGGPVFTSGPSLPSTYPEKPEEYPQKKTRLSDVECFNLDQVKEAVYAWIEYAAKKGSTHPRFVYVPSEKEMTVEFWEEEDGTLALYVQLSVEVLNSEYVVWNGDMFEVSLQRIYYPGLYEFRVTRRKA